MGPKAIFWGRKVDLLGIHRFRVEKAHFIKHELLP